MAELEEEQEEALPRNTYKGTDEAVEALAQVLEDVAKVQGKSVCKYRDESKKCTDAKIIHGREGGVQGEHVLLAGLRALHKGLSFPRSVLLRALDLVLERMKRKGEKAWEAMTKS